MEWRRLNGLLVCFIFLFSLFAEAQMEPQKWHWPFPPSKPQPRPSPTPTPTPTPWPPSPNNPAPQEPTPARPPKQPNPAPRPTKDYVDILSKLNSEDLRTALTSVNTHGLEVSNYWTPLMENAYQKNGFTPDLVSLTIEKYYRLLSDVSIGVVDPAFIGYDIKLDRKKFLTAPQLQVLLLTAGNNPSTLVDAIAPQNPLYTGLRQSLGKVVTACTDGTWQVIAPVKVNLKMGVRNKVIPQIKQRLAFLGYPIGHVDDDLFDYDMFNAIVDIQWGLHIKPDGIITPGGNTWAWLGVQCQARAQQIRMDMEKLRWFPQRFEPRHIVVNLAMSYFSLVDATGPQPITMSFKTINGRPERKSPTLQDKIVQVILNPFWIVPPTVFMLDKVKEILDLQPWQIDDYFNLHHYEVWNYNFTQRLDPASIDWRSIGTSTGSSNDIYIRQEPHLGNALGVVKFELTNGFSIYLHDTNQRELFAEPMRLLSSGCIRLEKPIDLATYLLSGTQWTRDKIEATVAKPGQVMTKDTPINLKNPMPVYLIFLTSQYSGDGVLRFVEDYYQQNQTIFMYMRD
jgi:murein L,D-transpeptidase YcbB/YkuD